MGSLENRIAIVTGAARGVGETIAATLIREGARVVLTDILGELGRKTAEKLGQHASFADLDVTRESDWDRVVAETLRTHARIDILVHNAAILHLGSIENTSGDVFRRVLEVNTVGPFLGTRAVVPPDEGATEGLDRVRQLDRWPGRHERRHRLLELEVRRPRPRQIRRPRAWPQRHPRE